MDLFCKQETGVFFGNLIASFSKEIEAMSDKAISECNIDEYVEYVYSEYSVEPIELYVEQATRNVVSEKVKRYNHFSGRSPYEQEYFYPDGYKITYTIEFDGDSALFHLKPSSFVLSSFPIDNVRASSDDEYGKLTYSFDFTARELDEKENANDFISNHFNSEFKHYITMIGNVNREVAQYNQSIKDTARKLLEQRLLKANKLYDLREKLNIPLHENSNAPNSVPVRLKKAKKAAPQKPQSQKASPEYTIADSDYSNINSIISMAGTSFEHTAKTFSRLSEEELRDVILANLNTHYMNLATGETFSKTGKTDIRIQFENKAAYVGECKIWHGEKQFGEALQQLFGYITWRDVKTSLILFNKDNKNFTNVIETIDVLLKSQDTCTHSINTERNIWQAKFKKNNDSADIVDVHVIVFDLYC